VWRFTGPSVAAVPIPACGKTEDWLPGDRLVDGHAAPTDSIAGGFDRMNDHSGYPDPPCNA